MPIWIHVALLPFGSYFMSMLWVAMFGDTFSTLAEKSAIEEWLICLCLYPLIVFISKLLKSK